jgi:hypothetical protein
LLIFPFALSFNSTVGKESSIDYDTTKLNNWAGVSKILNADLMVLFNGDNFTCFFRMKNSCKQDYLFIRKKRKRRENLCLRHI